jgi:short-subunit dehydrogenase
VTRGEAHFGAIDLLINHASIITVGPMDTMTLEDYRKAMDTNFWAAVYTVLSAVPGMKRRREGRIVNISSIGGKISVPHLLQYCASKFALVGFSRGLRAELWKDGIVVTTICPGLMRTGSPRNAEFKGNHEAEYAWFNIADSLPLTAISAERAARSIVRACKNGDGEVVLSLPAKLAVKFDALFPNISGDLLAFANYLLPGGDGKGSEAKKGYESESRFAPSWLTALGEAAARRNNEMA